MSKQVLYFCPFHVFSFDLASDVDYRPGLCPVFIMLHTGKLRTLAQFRTKPPYTGQLQKGRGRDEGIPSLSAANLEPLRWANLLLWCKASVVSPLKVKASVSAPTLSKTVKIL